MKRLQSRRDFLRLAAVSAGYGFLSSGCGQIKTGVSKRKKPNVEIRNKF
ncbi:twin-arginine translocation signal domain-containing protein [Candidatus Pacearchaeota archaeon]|nr:twin-arginine translocation signal domain-containing protein [Candidatus Pacearchaeota archaeon]